MSKHGLNEAVESTSHYTCIRACGERSLVARRPFTRGSVSKK